MKKDFDCLKMKEEIQSDVYEQTKNMTSYEFRTYMDKSMANNTLWNRLAEI
jgi:hypothetical protein